MSEISFSQYIKDAIMELVEGMELEIEELEVYKSSYSGKYKIHAVIKEGTD